MIVTGHKTTVEKVNIEIDNSELQAVLKKILHKKFPEQRRKFKDDFYFDHEGQLQVFHDINHHNGDYEYEPYKGQITSQDIEYFSYYKFIDYLTEDPI